MRKESEKKSVTKSVKMTQEQADVINEQANDKGMSFSAYALDCMVHRDTSLTPEIIVRVQEIVNCAERVIDDKDANLRDVQNARKEVKKLWELLEYVPIDLKKLKKYDMDRCQ